MALRQEAHTRAAIARAIIDSGASGTFVPGAVVLSNVRPGRGAVSVANGQREAIAQIGNLGPLKGVQKVNSFRRILVSVMQLCKQFGPVIFTDKGVQIASQGGPGEKFIVTTIGRPTPNNLLTFDLKALCEHAKALQKAKMR